MAISCGGWRSAGAGNKPDLGKNHPGKSVLPQRGGLDKIEHGDVVEKKIAWHPLGNRCHAESKG
jgi:hypothetical protein